MWIGVYAVGWLLAAIGACAFWLSEFGTDRNEMWQGAAWGALVGILWPLVLPIAVIACFGRMLARGWTA
jgi:hypothetical protein